MTAPGFRVVDQNVARNPIARAVASRRLESAVRDFALRLYLLAAGECVEADAQAAATVLAVAIRIIEGSETWQSAAMPAGMRRLVALAERGYLWSTDDARSLDDALRVAMLVYRTATAQQTQDAHNFVMGLQ